MICSAAMSWNLNAPHIFQRRAKTLRQNRLRALNCSDYSHDDIRPMGWRGAWTWIGQEVGSASMTADAAPDHRSLIHNENV